MKLQLDLIQIVGSLFISGITGNVSINDNGDRDADYALLDMDPETGIFQVERLILSHLINIFAYHHRNTGNSDFSLLQFIEDQQKKKICQ